MVYKNIQYLESDGIQIAASAEGENSEEHPLYYPFNALCYIEQGQFNLRIDNRLRVITAGNFFLVRKYTHGTCFKTWNKDENGFRFIAFALQDEFIEECIRGMVIPETTSSFPQKVIELPYSHILDGLMQSLSSYFHGNLKMEKPLVKLKTQEALLGMMKVKPELIHIFKEFSIPAKAELNKFMEHHITDNIPLEQLARLSGRSLSTFNREFKKFFNISPHKWIKKERLELAKRLLLETPKRPSDIYLEVGFEDLAHFSKSFKKYFGKNPSEIKPQTS